MSHWIAASQIFDGTHVLTDHAVRLENGRVSDMQPVAKIPATSNTSRHEGVLTPGFFDIQVNGGGGALFNAAPTLECIATIAAAHRALGTTAILPTIITDAPDVLEKAAEAIMAARDIPGVAGLHIEGPHISLTKRGTHAAKFIRPLDDQTMAVIARLRGAGIPVLITLAPEAATVAQVEALVDTGTIVAIGHSDASAEVAGLYLAAGATIVTHLFNAMSQMQSREPGLTGAAISSDAYCSVIADGIHVDPTMLTLACRARPLPNRMIAISDAMATVEGPDSFELYGQTISVQDGRLINADGALAGAHLSLGEAAANLLGYGLPLAEVLRMCRGNPARAMGLDQGIGLIGCPTADLVFLDATLKVQSVGWTPTD